jgi:hypothetical protein
LMNFLAIPSSLSRSYSALLGDNLNWNSCIHACQNIQPRNPHLNMQKVAQRTISFRRIDAL